MKAWLCMTPVQMQLVGSGQRLSLPPESLGLLSVYKTKKAGRVVHGPNAQFAEVDWEKEKK